MRDASDARRAVVFMAPLLGPRHDRLPALGVEGRGSLLVVWYAIMCEHLRV